MTNLQRHDVLIAACAILMFCFGCKEPYPPPRPDGVPPDGTYAWNGYSGEWVKCDVTGSNSITCDRFDPLEGEFDLRLHLQVCLNLLVQNGLERPPAIPTDTQGYYALFNEVRFFHTRAPQYIGSAERSSERVQAVLRMSELVFQEYGVSESCEPLGRSVGENGN